MKLELKQDIRHDLRPSSSADIRVVSNIIKDNLLSELNNKNTGFLINYPNSIEYKTRLDRNKYNLITELNDKIIGTLINFSSDEIQAQISQGYLLYEKGVLDFLFNLNDKFIWLDQMVIHPKKYRRMGFSKLMVEKTLEMGMRDGYMDYYCMISIFPETNIPSLNLFTSLGFRIVDTQKINNRGWAIMHKSLNSHVR